MAEPYTITTDDILKNKDLRLEGALPGDVIQEGELIRVFSKEGDERKEGYSITESDLNSNEDLRSDGAEVGDQIIDGEIVKNKDNDFFEQFKYGYDKATGLPTKVGDIIESYIPMGGFTFDFTNGFDYIPPDERYGKGYSEATPQERREMIVRARNRELMEEYGPNMMAQDAGASTAGEIVGSLVDPTTLLPVGAGYKGVMAISGGLGGAFSAAEDFRTKGEVDLGKAALMATGTALTGGAIKFGVDKLARRSANKLVNKVEDVIQARVKKGDKVSTDDIPQIADDLGVNPKRVEKAYNTIGRKPYVGLHDPADEALNVSLTTDETMVRKISEGAENLFGSLYTNIKNISPRVADSLRMYEANLAKKTADTLNKAQPFMEGMNKLAPKLKDDLTRYMFNGKDKEAQILIEKYAPELAPSYNETKGLLKGLGDDLVNSNLVEPSDLVDNYFPRFVKDFKNLKANLGDELQGKFTKTLQDYAKFKGVDPKSIDDHVQSQIIDKVIRGYTFKTNTPKPSFVKERTIEDIPSDLMQFYGTAEETLSMHIRNSINAVERRNFIGVKPKSLFETPDEITSSLSTKIQKEISEGRLVKEDETKLLDLLNSRFIHGEKTMNSSLKLLRDSGYASTIANPISAITQLADVGSSAALKGPINTAIGLAKSVLKTNRITLDDLGLADDMSREFSDPSKLVKVLNRALNVSGFKAVDRIGKETLINASLRKNQKLVRGSKGIAKLEEKYGGMFGDEFDLLLNDLRSKEITDRVKLMAFSDLSDFQPVSLSEFPPAYLNNPNARIMYMLKSFTLKQWDVARREVYQKLKKKGSRAEGLKNLSALAVYLTGANVGTSVAKDMLLGKSVSVDELPDRALFGLIGVYGFNKYSSEKFLAKGEIKDAIVSQLAPATPLLDAATKGLAEISEEEPELGFTLRSIPIIGPMAYYWLGGGIEKYEERKDRATD